MWDYRAKRSDKPRGKGDDGDTVLMIVDLGMGVHTEQAIRLSRCFAPELKQAGGREAAKFLAMAMEEIEERARAKSARWPFVVVTEKNASPEADEKRSFVRFIGEIFAADTGQSLNSEVAEFLALHKEWGGGIGGDEA